MMTMKIQIRISTVKVMPRPMIMVTVEPSILSPKDRLCMVFGSLKRSIKLSLPFIHVTS